MIGVGVGGSYSIGGPRRAAPPDVIYYDIAFTIIVYYTSRRLQVTITRYYIIYYIQ